MYDFYNVAAQRAMGKQPTASLKPETRLPSGLDGNDLIDKRIIVSCYPRERAEHTGKTGQTPLSIFTRRALLMRSVQIAARPCMRRQVV
uniref:Uncharacterized protein n=1 Tax=Anguilla anguilla TaxID=7936 RepID=A0A0E9REG9_ANGAN